MEHGRFSGEFTIPMPEEGREGHVSLESVPSLAHTSRSGDTREWMESTCNLRKEDRAGGK